MDFSRTIYNDYITALFGKPLMRRNAYTYVIAFSWQVWVLTFVTLLIVSTAAVFLYTCGPDERINKRLTIQFVEEQFWLFFGVLLQQGMANPPKRCPVRILNAAWWLGGAVLAAYFNSRLISLMVVYKNYDKLEDLLIENSLTTPVVSASTLADIKDAKDLYRQMRNKVGNGTDTNINVFSDEFMDKVSEGTHSVIAFSIDIQNAVSNRYSQNKRCEYHFSEATQSFYKELSMAFRKSIPKGFLEIINTSLMKMSEKGVFKAILSKVLNSQVDCFFTSPDSFRPMNYDDLSGVFTLWIAGISFGVAAFGVEWLLRVFHNCHAEKPCYCGGSWNARPTMLAKSPQNDQIELVQNSEEVGNSHRRRRQRSYTNRPIYTTYPQAIDKY